MNLPVKPHFIHLGIRSPYSIAEGAVRKADILDYCAEHRSPAIGIADTDGMFGALRNASFLHKAGIQPIIGTRLPVCLEKEQEQPCYISLYPQSPKGYQNLIELSSSIYTAPASSLFPCVTLESVLLHADGLLAHTGTKDGMLMPYLAKQQVPEATNVLSSLYEVFNERLYLAAAYHGYSIEKSALPAILKLAKTFKLPLLAIQDVLFYKSLHYKAQCILHKIRHKDCHIDQISLDTLSDQHFLKNPREMANLFQDIPEAIENTWHFKERIAFMPTKNNPIMPRFDQKLSLEEEDALFESTTRERLLEKFKLESIPMGKQALYQERLQFEMDVILKMGYAGYFLIVMDFVNWAKANHIPVGPGRGSGAASLVAWSLGITTLDPIKWGLMFERFLNPERISLPDFDIDFCPEGRDDVIAYVAERYGKERVAQIITFGALRARAAVQDVGRALGKTYGELEAVSKQIPQLGDGGKTVPLKEGILQATQLQQQIKTDPELKEWIDLALQIEGLYRNISTHAGGVIIARDPLKKITPLYKDPESALHITQFDMSDSEASGLVKFDFLGLITLTIIDKTIKLIEKRHHCKLNADAFPLDDQKTYQQISSGETFGIFQIESAGMRDAVVKLKPDKFDEIIALVALYRPGPIKFIPSFIDRKFGREEVSYPFPQLESILKETYGIPVYQEQVVQIAQSVAGFSLGKSDVLRRAMGKKQADVMESLKEEFICSAIDHSSISKKDATSLFDIIEDFSNYGFNKAHSAGYGLLCFQTAYLKTHYPLEFFVTSMNSDQNNTDRIQKYLEPLRLHGISLLPPDINESDALFSIVNTNKDGKSAIRYGLGILKNVGTDAMQKVVAIRGNTPFESIEDFALRVDPTMIPKRALIHLIAAGVFDSLHYQRADLIDKVPDIINSARQSSEDARSHQGNLFGEQAMQHIVIVEKKTANNVLSSTRNSYLSQLEKTAFGFYFSNHPLLPLKHLLDKNGFVFSDKLHTLPESNLGRLCFAGELIRFKSMKPKENGGRKRSSHMENYMLSISDIHGITDIFLSGDTYQEFDINLREELHTLICVEANGKFRDGRLFLSAFRAYAMDDYLKAITLPLSITLYPKAEHMQSQLQAIKSCCITHGKENQNQVPIYIALKNEGADCHQEPEIINTGLTAGVSLETIKNLAQISGVKHVAFHDSSNAQNNRL